MLQECVFQHNWLTGVVNDDEIALGTTSGAL
jgi:hypothetical protein